MKVVALAGGTGSAKLLRGLSYLGSDLTVVANVGDNIWMHGLYVCPDIDIAMYTLAGIADRKRGWGVGGDTFNALSQLKREGADGWFALGDRDLATHIIRSAMIGRGSTLTEVTRALCASLGVRSKILPATDQDVETHVKTPSGTLHLQEFWVREGGRPRVLALDFRGASRSRPTEEAKEAINEADRIVICPANPITSIGPMLSIPGFTNLLSGARGRISALSPMIGSGAFSGPAAKLMKAVGYRADSLTVALMYSRFLDVILIDRSDIGLSAQIRATGVECHLTKSAISGPSDEKRLARVLLDA